MSGSPRSVVVISSHVALLERLVGNAGFSVVGAADLAPNGERLVELFEPSFVIVDSDLPGEQDLALIGRLRQVAPHTSVLLIVNQQHSMLDAGSLGVGGVLGREDLLELGPLLLDLERAAMADAGVDRRSGRERRVNVDWSKIGWEYRSEIRRAEDRRDEEIPA